jgi:hypothetical protein
MTSSKKFFTALGLITFAVFFQGCGNALSLLGSQNALQNPTNGVSLAAVTGPNVMALTVNGANCAAGSYANKPCVSVTICAPGDTTNCQTVNDILLDTGSYGLRVFKSAMNTTLSNALAASPVQISSNTVAECVNFGDGTSDWGPVENATLLLGSEPAVNVPVHVIDSTFTGQAAKCSGADASPAAAGFNGILGVGLLVQDCPDCVSSPSNGMYFACGVSTCTGSEVPLAKQVTNPIALIPVDPAVDPTNSSGLADNNGVIIMLPLIGLGGVADADGYVVFGIGTRTNNAPSGVNTYTANTGNRITTNFTNQSGIESFLDTGSNGLFFPEGSSGLVTCTSETWYCPGSTVSLTATNVSSSGTLTGTIPFSIGNTNALDSTANSVFIELGANSTVGNQSVFDWGLPFFLGRNVYVGFTGKSSSLGMGPYWSY